jgi:23S rRNA U2552 (ribose-2'-O)-methylase RlmE/FtsJ
MLFFEKKLKVINILICMNQNTYLLQKDPNENYPIPNISLKFDKTEVNEIYNIYEYNQLIYYKNRIDTLEDNKLWDSAKKLSNIYELIYVPNKKFKYDSVSKYEPLSRAYFKLFEILVDFDLINNPKILKIGSLAEGPGGFIEATVNYRKRITNKYDNINAITLYSTNKDIPGWNKSKNFLKKNPNVNITYGKDKTGDLYNVENIKSYASLFNNDADFITADGGFDFSYNFNKQEQLSYRILFCEIVTAISIQKIEGCFVCKFFDMYTNITQSLIYLLYTLYKEVYITKPNTSRAANSEKYIVCRGFLGIDTNYIKKLYILIGNFKYIYNNKMNINQIFDFNIDINFKSQLNKINTIFFNNQINSIISTLSLIKQNNLDVEFNNTIKKQTILAFKWCKYYKISINYNSKYLIKYNKFIN